VSQQRPDSAAAAGYSGSYSSSNHRQQKQKAV